MLFTSADKIVFKLSIEYHRRAVLSEETKVTAQSLSARCYKNKLMFLVTVTERQR